MSTEMNLTTTWDDVRGEWSKAQQMGYQAVMQAARVGQMLIDMKGDEPIREFVQRAGQELGGLSRSTVNDLMNLAEHRDLIESKQPQSKRAALELIRASTRPPTPKRNPNAIAEIKREAAESRAKYSATYAKAQEAANDEVGDVIDGGANELYDQLYVRDGGVEQAAGGVFTTSEYALIRDCLDPTCEVVAEEKAEAFDLFTSRYELLVRREIDQASASESLPGFDILGELGEQRAA
jgi:hypothetical protein